MKPTQWANGEISVNREQLEKVRDELHEADTAGNGGDLGGMQSDVRNAIRMLEAILEGREL